MPDREIVPFEVPLQALPHNIAQNDRLENNQIAFYRLQSHEIVNSVSISIHFFLQAKSLEHVADQQIVPSEVPVWALYGTF